MAPVRRERHAGPQALIHGDPHIGNTYVCADDEDRRSVERHLVDTYLDALDLPIDERPDRDDIWRRYRAGASYGMALWLATAASRWQRREVSIALATRDATAFVDLDSVAAIDELAG